MATWRTEEERAAEVHRNKREAEDGIRDAQESRGLGDVYKRQIKGDYQMLRAAHHRMFLRILGAW